MVQIKTIIDVMKALEHGDTMNNLYSDHIVFKKEAVNEMIDALTDELHRLPENIK